MQHRHSLSPHSTQGVSRGKRLNARRVLGILLEQGLAEREARQRIDGDPELREQLWADEEQRH